MRKLISILLQNPKPFSVCSYWTFGRVKNVRVSLRLTLQNFYENLRVNLNVISFPWGVHGRYFLLKL